MYTLFQILSAKQIKTPQEYFTNPKFSICITPLNQYGKKFVFTKSCLTKANQIHLKNRFFDEDEIRKIDLKIIDSWDYNVDDYKDIIDKIINHINNKPILMHITNGLSGDKDNNLSDSKNFKYTIDRLFKEARNHFFLEVHDRVFNTEYQQDIIDYISEKVNNNRKCLDAYYCSELLDKDTSDPITSKIIELKNWQDIEK
tara:strand:- start:216 stop:815 length:600 start_codon:yes stop_codon:yes gene_type:complete